MKAIPTTFDGVNFRSRLEARWAAMFNLLGWRWTYEPLDLDGYIPDFLVRDFLYEVKPADGERELREYAKELARHERSLIVVGLAPIRVGRQEALGVGAWGDLPPVEFFAGSRLTTLWREAGNQVQWRRR